MSDAHTTPTLRAALDALPHYRAGRSASVQAQAAYKVSSNENPFPPLPAIAAAISDAAAGVNRYPDFGSTEATTAIAQFVGVDDERITVGTGSVALLQSAVNITCDDDDEVVFAWRSFEAYPIVTRVAGAVPVQVPVTSTGAHDLDAMLAAIGPRTRMVIVCSPNNPTGTVVQQAELDAFIDAVPTSVLIVIDEAYTEFVVDPLVPNAVERYADRSNVCVMRTFSKAYGLAGIRVGYAVASERVTGALRSVGTPFGVSSVAQYAVVAALGTSAQIELQQRVEAITLERERVVEALLAIGIDATHQQGNFVWLPLGERSVAFGHAADAVGLSVRVFDGDGVRVTVAEPRANDLFLALATDFPAR